MFFYYKPMVVNNALETWPIRTPGHGWQDFKGDYYTQNIKVLCRMVSEKKICFNNFPIDSLWKRMIPGV